MYKKPTRKQIRHGRMCGWQIEECKRGYTAIVGHGDLLEIERIDDVFGASDVDDDDCSIEAVRSGFCKIIPVEELPEDFPAEWKYFGFVDTPENREGIRRWRNVRRY